MKFKKILIVTDARLNDGTGTGITLSNLFRGWQSSAFALYSVKNDKTNNSILYGRDCFRAGQGKALLDQKLKFKPKIILGYFKDIVTKSRIRPYLTFFAPINISIKAKTQMHSFSPELIFAPVSDVFSIRRVISIQKMTKANLGIIFFDDLIDRYDNLFFNRFFKWMHLKFLQRVVALATNCYVCSEAMRIEYEKIFNVSFHVLSNPVDLKKVEPFRPKNTNINPFNVIYGGTVNSKNINNLKLMSQAVQLISEMGIEIEFNLYTSSEKLNYTQDQFSEYPGKFKISLIPNDDQDLFDLFGKASILYIPMDFSKESVRSIRLSYLTKQPLYMSLGVPLIVHGPETIHVVEHAKTHGYADVVTDPSLDALVQSILNHINGYDKFVQQTDIGLAYAKENHSIDKVQESFYGQLLKTKCG